LSKGPDIATPNAQTKAYNLAEAKFLRAYAYLWLTKVYDGVPLLLSPEEQANPRPERTPVEQVHQAIIQDLTEAEADLPATWPATDGFGDPTQGRVTKAAAQMALADLYLWRSTYMQRNEWQQASDAAKRVVDSGLWSLNADYLRTFRPSNKGNREMIFVIANSGMNSRTGTIFQLFYYPRDWGLDRGQGGGWGLIHPTAWFWNSYAPGDYRRDGGADYTTSAAYVTGGCGLSNLCATPLADGPMPYKYKKSDNGANWDISDVDTPLYRYAEALLFYAEAQNELGNTGTAATYLNMIRARAQRDRRREPARAGRLRRSDGSTVGAQRHLHGACLGIRLRGEALVRLGAPRHARARLLVHEPSVARSQCDQPGPARDLQEAFPDPAGPDQLQPGAVPERRVRRDAVRCWGATVRSAPTSAVSSLPSALSDC